METKFSWSSQNSLQNKPSPSLRTNSEVITKTTATIRTNVPLNDSFPKDLAEQSLHEDQCTETSLQTQQILQQTQQILQQTQHTITSQQINNAIQSDNQKDIPKDSQSEENDTMIKYHDPEPPKKRKRITYRHDPETFFLNHYTPSNTWTVLSARVPNVQKPGIQSESNLSECIKVMVQNSKESPFEWIPEKLYSSLKYLVYHHVDWIKLIKFCQSEEGDKIDLESGHLFARIQVINASNNEEITRHGKPILSGDFEGSLVLSGVTKMKIQFISCSSHHDKASMSLRISYFLNGNFKNPILVRQSNTFKVFARKKTMNQRNQIKKNVDENFEKFDSFVYHVSEAQNVFESLNPWQQKQAQSIISSRFNPSNKHPT